MKLIHHDDTLTFDDALHIYTRKVDNQKNLEDPFYYKGRWSQNSTNEPFDFNTARMGSRFFDGCNGDEHRIVTMEGDDYDIRCIVQNLGQGGLSLFEVTLKPYRQGRW